MADRYINEVRTVQPSGPYRLGGYCFGGLVAFEMARRLVALGQDIDLLVMFNASSPSYLRRYPNSDPVDRAVGASIKRHLAEGAHGAARARGLATAVGRRANQMGRNLRTDIAVRLDRPLSDNLRDGASPFQRIAARAQRAYNPPPYEGSVVVVSAKRLYDHAPDLLWSEHVTGNVDTLVVPGEQTVPRMTMREPFVAFVADGLNERLELLNAATPS
jgi:thioesterase domain-containing protein